MRDRRIDDAPLARSQLDHATGFPAAPGVGEVRATADRPGGIEIGGAVDPGAPTFSCGEGLFFRPGQPIGTLNGAILDGEVISSGILTGTGPSSQCAALSDKDDDELLALPVDGRAHDVHIFGVGDYRVSASEQADGVTLVDGPPDRQQ